MSAFWYFACAHITYSDHLEKLISTVSSIDELWDMLTPQLWCADRRYEASWQRIAVIKKDQAYYQDLRLQLHEKGIEVITFDNAYYPPFLKEIYAPPLAIFVKGNKELLGRDIKVSIVGTRKPTHYGVQVTKLITQVLLDANVIPVSGLAYGIDSAVHEVGISNDRGSIAVIPAALTDEVLGGNSFLCERMMGGRHMFLTETLPGEKLTKFHFVKRNRLIAGLSKWLIVTEAPAKSGALITARYALESGREVIAVPHTLQNETGVGCLNLIRDGATILTTVSSVHNILFLPNIMLPAEKLFKSELEREVYSKVSQGLNLEEIIEAMKISKETALRLLGALTLRGDIRMLYDGSYLAE